MPNSRDADWLSLFQPRQVNPLETMGQVANIVGTIQQGDQNQQRLDTDLQRLAQEQAWKERTFPLDQLLGKAQAAQMDSAVRVNDSNIQQNAQELELKRRELDAAESLQPLQSDLIRAQISEMLASGQLHGANAAQALAYVNALMPSVEPLNPRDAELLQQFKQLSQ